MITAIAYVLGAAATLVLIVFILWLYFAGKDPNDRR